MSNIKDIKEQEERREKIRAYLKDLGIPQTSLQIKEALFPEYADDSRIRRVLVHMATTGELFCDKEMCPREWEVMPSSEDRNVPRVFHDTCKRKEVGNGVTQITFGRGHEQWNRGRREESWSGYQSSLSSGLNLDW